MTYPDTGSTQDLTKEKLHELLIEVDLEYLVDRPVRTINATWSIFRAIFTFKRSWIILPRQARGKHRESTQKQLHFSQGVLTDEINW
jgi:hypothetical protein